MDINQINGKPPEDDKDQNTKAPETQVPSDHKCCDEDCENCPIHKMVEGMDEDGEGEGDADANKEHHSKIDQSKLVSPAFRITVEVLEEQYKHEGEAEKLTFECEGFQMYLCCKNPNGNGDIGVRTVAQGMVNYYNLAQSILEPNKSNGTKLLQAMGEYTQRRTAEMAIEQMVKNMMSGDKPPFGFKGGKHPGK